MNRKLYSFFVLLVAIFCSFSSFGQIINTVAGSGVGTSSGDGGPATSAIINGVLHTCMDPSGNLYITEFNSHKVRKVTPSGIISTFAGTGYYSFSGDGGAATAATLRSPIGLASDAAGNVYIADYDNFRIRKVNTSGIISTYAGSGTLGHSGDGGAATAANMQAPWGLACDPSGNLYVCENSGSLGTPGSRVRKIDPSGIISTFAGTGTAGFSGDGGPATAAAIYNPINVVSDGAGNIYFSDFGNYRVRMVNTSGIINTVAGNGAVGSSGDGGAATAARINPIGVALDGGGSLYIGDYTNFRVRRVDPLGIITTFAGTGTAGFSGDGGPATAAQLSTIYGVGVYGGNNIYICDAGNWRLRYNKGVNRIPYFTAGDTAGVVICQNTVGDSINTALAVIDTDIFQREIWSIVSAPLHGTVVVADTALALGGTVTPTGLYYAPSSGYLGRDTFRVKVTDGYAFDTITIYATVVASPASITGAAGVCIGSTITLSTTTTGGTWTSNITTIATVGTGSGIVTSVSVGTSLISYTIGTGCSATKIVTVHPLPSPITGVTTFCSGYVTTLTNTGGGTWSSSAAGVVTAGSSSGYVYGVAPGTSVITYTLPTGCIATTTVTVTFSPTTILGTRAVCEGNMTSLSDATAGGAWSSSITTVATIGTGGVVSGVSAGTTTISYTLGSCAALATVTVHLLAPPITGMSSVCAGSTITLFSGTGGAWISSAASVATVGTSSGVVFAVAPGTSTLSYLYPTGCFAVSTVSVTPVPLPILGSRALCVGSVSTLSSSTVGGTWSSSMVTRASIGLSTGIATGIASGTSTFTYSASGCHTLLVATVYPLPSPILGITSVCEGSTVTISNITPGGSWYSSDAAVATADVSTGAVTGVLAGTATISYVLPTGCSTGLGITVRQLPGAILGGLSVCVGTRTTLSSATPGGNWTSGTPTVATVNVSSGVVTGLMPGTAIITYRIFTTGCQVTSTVTVSPTPTAIAGTGSLCVGASAFLTNSIPGGTWSSGTSFVATIGSATGFISGLAAGTSIISYSLGASCLVTRVMSVYASPDVIAGPLSVCTGATASFTNSVIGGTWSSSSAFTASIGSATGVLVGLVTGTSVLTYTLSTGCATTTTVTVTSGPGAISGSLGTCIGSTSTLSSATSGGTWTSASPIVATIDAISGVLTGVSSGTSVITYSLGGGCQVTSVRTVYPNPGSITGPTSVCMGSTATLSGPGIGTWASSVGAIGSSTGIVTGITPGISTITFTLSSTGCTTTRSMTTDPVPAPIGGGTTICVGSSSTLTHTSSGTWSSGSASVASIHVTSGIVTGVAFGTSLITFTTTAGCRVITTVVVSPAPGPIGGPSSVCVGSAVTLSNSVTGGIWSTGCAGSSVGSSSGIVSGLSAGACIVTYSLGSGCTSTLSFTVHPTPGAITGTGALCAGASATLASSTAGGGWSSSSPGIASINTTSGGATGVATGTTTISYGFATTGCYATTTLAVSPAPGSVLGAAAVCVGATATLSNSSAGGLWISSNTAVASIGSSSGIISGITPGTTTITYSLGSGCTVTRALTVFPAPAPISGPGAVCIGATVTLASSTTGGTWSSAASGIVSIGATTGYATGISVGSASITYTLPTGCSAVTVVVASPAPSAIGGSGVLCAGSQVTLTNTVVGGTWVSSNTAAATVGLSTGVVSGVAPGVSIITYSLGGGCIAVRTVSVAPGATIGGSTSICAGSSTSLIASISGGTWASGTTSVATVTVSSGFVSGVSVGTSVMSYTLPTGCVAVATVLVNARPGVIAGAATLCAGATTTYTNSIPGGTWSSSALSIATADAASGIITGVSAGVVSVTYSLGSGCIATSTLAVLPLPAPITGSLSVCVGAFTSLASATTGGTWSDASGSSATVNTSTGVVFGIVPGSEPIYYTAASGCTRSVTVIVSPPPAPIMGTLEVCPGSSTSLSNTDAGGTWSAPGFAAMATVGALSGVVYGVSPGTARITYATSSGCSSIAVATVLPLPLAISGVAGVCAGAGTTLSHATTGGAWFSSDASIAAIDMATGVVSSYSAGTTTLTYTTSGCPAVSLFTVYPQPSPISGSTGICAGLTATMASTPSGGVWGVTSGGIATVSASMGVVQALASGTAIVSYTLSTGCSSVTGITVYPAPPAIAGTSSACLGSSTTLSNSLSGGIWASSHSATATIDAGSGVLSGLAAGTATISYTVGGCPALITFTVHPLPAPITGAMGICAWGGTLALTSATPGGGWSSAGVTISTAGIATAHAAGAASVTYTMPTGCEVMAHFPVYPLPAFITGVTSICLGTTATLSDSVMGGTWSSSATGIADIGSASGIYRGLSVGAATISYTLPTGCARFALVNILPVPDTILGPGSVCAGASISLTNTTVGGTWLSASPSVAVLDTFTGAAAGVSPGIAIVTYRLGSGCFASRSLTVHSLPTRYSVTGGGNYCAGGTGRPVGLGSTSRGVAYQLYLGGSPVGIGMAGFGSSLAFGLQTLPGTYTVYATDTLTGCGRAMAGSATIAVDPVVVPSVTYTPGAGFLICDGTPVTFTASPINGGTSPGYIWVKNGTTAGTGSPVLTYVPANGDILQVLLTSNALCVSPDTASYSSIIDVTPLPPLAVTVTAAPGTVVEPGTTVLFTATVTSGSAVAYQWKKNGTNIAGALSATYATSAISHRDTISCTVTSGGPCPVTANGWVRMQVVPGIGVGIGSHSNAGNLSVSPNPSTGSFHIKGTVVAPGDASVSVTDELGRVVYNRVMNLSGTDISVIVDLGADIPAGNYVMQFLSGGDTYMFRLSVVK